MNQHQMASAGERQKKKPVFCRDMLIAGRREILNRLKLEHWDSVMKLKEEAGFPMAKLGGRWILTERHLSEWLDRHCQGDPSAPEQDSD